MGNANIPVGMKSMGDWHVMFQQKDGMLMMWATQAPMDELKQMVVKVGTAQAELTEEKLTQRRKGAKVNQVLGFPDPSDLPRSGLRS